MTICILNALALLFLFHLSLCLGFSSSLPSVEIRHHDEKKERKMFLICSTKLLLPSHVLFWFSVWKCFSSLTSTWKHSPRIRRQKADNARDITFIVIARFVRVVFNNFEAFWVISSSKQTTSKHNIVYLRDRRLWRSFITVIIFCFKTGN